MRRTGDEKSTVRGNHVLRVQIHNSNPQPCARARILLLAHAKMQHAESSHRYYRRHREGSIAGCPARWQCIDVFGTCVCVMLCSSTGLGTPSSSVLGLPRR